MAKKKALKTKKAGEKQVKTASSGQFKPGDKRINREGANKGSRWKKTLLKDLLALPLGEEERAQFEELKAKFPKIFKDEKAEVNFQLFLELKQISLAFDQDGNIAQRAISAIKDRIDGKPKQAIDHTTNGKPIRPNINFSDGSTRE